MPAPVIVVDRDASRLEQLAAREVRRYVYLRTGTLLTIAPDDPEIGDPRIIIGRKDRRHVFDATDDEAVRTTLLGLKKQQYLLHTIRDGGSVIVAGGDDVGTLYAAYRFAERLGVGFGLEGDTVPDNRMVIGIPMVREVGKPLFDLRGIQPFHDFPDGPDWWNADHYKGVISQLPKLRMNFFGLHTYPEGGVGPEPTVWIGKAEDVAPDGRAGFSYPSTWMNTLRGTWGYAPKKTGDYVYGASQLFEADDYGPDVMRGYCPRPTTPQGDNEVFARAGALLREAFGHARQLGIRTCVGTETPLTVPKLVRERLKADGSALSQADVQSLYEGMFQWVMRNYPLDYYWLWTPEDWTWQGVTDERVAQTILDIRTAIAAGEKVNATFTLATCGWVLGPPQNRSLFDEVLPKSMPVSCINRQVGKDPVEPGFARIQGRGKWAIPWMEDDPNLISPQLWAGRMRKDAADALKYGCDGLMGIHWRTRILNPNVSALAQAAWNQDDFAEPEPPVTREARKEGPAGGNYAVFPQAIAGTDESAIYQTVRWNVSGYHLAVPNGRHTVTLKFCEPHYTQKGQRVFGVKLQGRTVIDSLDIVATAGKDKALDYIYKDIPVTDGWLDIEFIHITEFPCIAGIAIDGPLPRKINCGGPAALGYAADWPASGSSAPLRNRFLPVNDFYLDWARRQFGPEAAAEVSAVFARIDGRLPEPSTWIDGPGGIKADPKPWEDAERLYGFIDELEALRPRVVGAGNLERFDYWLDNFRYMKATEHVKHLWFQYNQAMKPVMAEKDAEARALLAREKALPIRKELVKAVERVYEHLLATASSPGELGTICNWEQHILPGLLIRPGEELAAALGTSLPDDAYPTHGYSGPGRIIVPTLRTSMRAGEALSLKVIILSSQPPVRGALLWRVMGEGDFASIPLRHVDRSVYRVTVPPQPANVQAIEYRIEVMPEGAPLLCYPATAPTMNHTVVIVP